MDIIRVVEPLISKFFLGSLKKEALLWYMSFISILTHQVLWFFLEIGASIFEKQTSNDNNNKII